MGYQLRTITGASVRETPPVCRSCVFWQSREGRPVDKARWAERVEEGFGAWGTLYVADGGRLLGSIQYGPAGEFPRAAELPAGPPSGDAVLITCAYLVDPSSPWVMQSLFLAVIGEARDRRIPAIETFGYRYPEGQSAYERFIAHRTVFPADFLADFGFYAKRADGRVELARLEVGGLVRVEETSVERLLGRAKELLAPQPGHAASRS